MLNWSSLILKEIIDGDTGLRIAAARARDSRFFHGFGVDRAKRRKAKR
jgi:hypothetical protein